MMMMASRMVFIAGRRIRSLAERLVSIPPCTHASQYALMAAKNESSHSVARNGRGRSGIKHKLVIELICIREKSKSAVQDHRPYPKASVHHVPRPLPTHETAYHVPRPLPTAPPQVSGAGDD